MSNHMSFNITNYDGKITSQYACINDSSVGYGTDFSVDGDVNGWTYYDGIHTYGCWNNFLFGTLYGSYGVVGRPDVFRSVPAEVFTFVKIVMKLNIMERPGNHVVPSLGRMAWLTLADPVWGSSKQIDFNIICDETWHTYLLNMGEAQWWQGDINNLRIYPILNNGRDGDEFLIKSIEIISTNNYLCNNVSCSYYTSYQHPCKGVGLRASCASTTEALFVQGGTTFEFSQDKKYTIEENLNDELLVNINGYGFEIVKLKHVSNNSGSQLAKMISGEISKIDVGGYAEVEVEYTNRSQFIIYSGTYTNDSSVEIGFNNASIYLGFFDSAGIDLSTKTNGSDPANGFKPFSSFKLQTHKMNNLLELGEGTTIYFNPDKYNVEGGRVDWLDVGIGPPDKDIRGSDTDKSELLNRTYSMIHNEGSTIIDFNHPFNASGRINKIYAAVTLDMWDNLSNYARAANPPDPFNGGWDRDRQRNQLSNAKIMFFRPMRDGSLKVLPIEVPIVDRDYPVGKIYSSRQEYVDIDCDVFVNKGDLIGIYNVNIYTGMTITGSEIDGLYYQIVGKASGVLNVSQPLGYGQSGLLIYARSSQKQDRLLLNLDLGNRLNVSNINVIGDVPAKQLEYNIARCLDIDWEVDMLDGDFTTSHVKQYTPTRIDLFYNHPSVYYGKNCLNDGIKIVPDGLAGDGFSIEMGAAYYSQAAANHKKDGGRTVIVSDAKYFQTNGDCEWLAVYYQIPGPACPCEPKSCLDFSSDPIAFTLKFPYGKEKLLCKSKIFFKERYNFRSFAISSYKGDWYTIGNADDPRFELIPNRTDGYETPWSKVTIDGRSYTPENVSAWQTLDTYLGKNPTVGHEIIRSTGMQEFSVGDRMDFGNIIEYDPLAGLVYYETGVITNNEDYLKTLTLDWTTLVHEWSPIRSKGYRFYCDYHASTKICEFEVYCVVENFKPSLAGMVDIVYSHYGVQWWISDLKETSDENSVSSFIGDTPRYINIEITPFTEIRLKSISIEISSEDVFMGDKGCNDLLLLDNAKKNYINDSSVVNFKNTYGRSYDLYVNIEGNSSLTNRGLIFSSKLNNAESITNPMVGADAYYIKHPDYKLLSYHGNVAINCPVYSLKNLIDGAKAWYSYDDEQSWTYHGELVDTEDINVSNVAYMSITTIMLPTIIRSKWWKFGFYDKRISMNVREIKVYYQNQEISGVKFYHHKGQTNVNTSSTDTAIHLENNNIFGSYYVLNGNGGYIGIELPNVGIIDKIVMYNDNLLDYEKSNVKAGIDYCTGVCVHGDGDMYQTNTIKDSSYYEHEVQTTGSGIYCDTTFSGIGKSGIRFNGYPNENIVIKYANNPICNFVDESFDFDIKRFTIDFFIKFNSLPTSGNKVIIAKSWLGDPLTSMESGSWAITLENVSGSYKLRFYINNDGVRRMLLDYPWILNSDIRYYVSLCRGQESNLGTEYDVYSSYGNIRYPCYHRGSLIIDNKCVYSNDPHTDGAGVTWGYHVYRSSQDVKLGENLDGWMDEFRISSSYTPGGGRHPNSNSCYPNGYCGSPVTIGITPTQQFEKYNMFSVYTSEDNFNYGKLVDVDVLFTTNYSYYSPENKWCRDYNSYFVIDLGQRYNIELIRSFPVDTAHQFTLSNYMKYSNNNTDDVVEAFKITEEQLDRIRNMDFSEEESTVPKDWSIEIVGAADSYIKENRYYQYADGVNSVMAQVTATSLFYLTDVFDTQIDFELDTTTNNNEWLVSFSVTDVENSNNSISVCRAFLSNIHQYAVYIQDNSGTATKVTQLYSTDSKGSFRIWRDKNSFIVYIKRQYQPDFQILYSYNFFNSTMSNSVVVKLVTTSKSQNFPSVHVYWNNFKVTYGTVDYFSTYSDARWLKIAMPNNGTTYTIKRIGVYPNVSVQTNNDGKYNTYWNYLGTSITDYSDDDNIAFGATVSGSSYIGIMRPENITDNVVGDDIDLCWGSDNAATQWITICLNEIQPIYRIVIYHGYDSSDIHSMVNDYTVDVSSDGVVFSTIFTVVNNTDFIRTHDSSTPINAKFIKINITRYTSINRFIWMSFEEKHQYWKGATLREVKIYKYNGFTVLSSESTPIIAIDLQQNYFISGHSLVGIDAEDAWTDWDNSNSNFAYSNSNLSDPHKVSFGEWGITPNYERWVVIKRDTATGYPNATERHPIMEPPSPHYDDAIPDYLKQVIVNASSDELGTRPNPTEYPWMWKSILSKLSYDYTHTYSIPRSLRIDYPASSGIEHVRNIEGDNLGIDIVTSWRDGCGFYWYIDDIDNIDLTYGYIYLGGYDDTETQNKINYIWNLASISGSLQSGWNSLSLSFLYADAIDYVLPADEGTLDVRRLYSVLWSRMGIVFRGKGNPIGMNFDGFRIARNHFGHSSVFDYGLYLHANDMLKVGVGGIDFSGCTIEFFVRPDWDWSSRDVLNDYKCRSLFHFSNTDNDVLGAIVTTEGLELYYGNITENLNAFTILDSSEVVDSIIDTIFHIAFVFSNDGSGMSDDNSTIRVYINNVLVAKSTDVWSIKDTKHFNFIFGGQGLLFHRMVGTISDVSAVDAVISNLKIFNYCKTNFDDSLNNNEDLENVGGSLIQPCELIEISSDNVTFHKIGSVGLPFVFREIEAGTSIPIYVRTNIPKKLIGKEKRTAGVVGSWDIGV